MNLGDARSLAPVLLAPVLLICVIASGCARSTAPERAVALARQHREEEGIAALREAIAKDPNDVEARKVLVRLVALTGDLRAAQAEATELVKRIPSGDPSAWIELGHAF